MIQTTHTNTVNMSDPINANPTILDSSQLPTRGSVREKPTDPDLELLRDNPLYSLSVFAPEYEREETPAEAPSLVSDASDSESEDQEPIDAQEIYDLISTISDPEHPLTLGQLAVVNLQHIWVKDDGDKNKIAEVHVEITPTITHCSLATLIGLGVRVRLERSLPSRFRVVITVRKGTHQSETQVNRQLNDKERVAAACENEQLLGVIGNMLATCK